MTEKGQKEGPMRTGDTCERTGIYRASCCISDLIVATGGKFDACPTCQKPTTWIMIHVATAAQSSA